LIGINSANQTHLPREAGQPGPARKGTTPTLTPIKVALLRSPQTRDAILWGLPESQGETFFRLQQFQ